MFSCAGGRPSDLPAMDGLDMWTALSKDEQSPRNLMLHNIDDRRLFASVRVGDWKFTRGVWELMHCQLKCATMDFRL